MEAARIWCQVCVYVAFIAAAVVATDVITTRRDVKTICPDPIRYYEDIECTPVLRNEQARCPSRYKCDHLKERSRTKCYINGHEYKTNQVLNREDANICEDV
ncbi:uncharacterized protein LOC143900808 [Temnothorax americanus]|uniref:uncharacterized protein LOC143900808 n=1 Tax=Temnothorax americanus TaxID=1964332 RepID=UPI0040687AFD